MRWIRWFLFAAPAGLVAALAWLAGAARSLEYRSDGDLIVAVRTRPRLESPLAPSTGAFREISELLFDRLMRLDDALEIRPHLASRWDYRHRATVFFESPGDAAAAARVMESERPRWARWALRGCVHDGDLLHLESSSPHGEWLKSLLARPDWAGLSRLTRFELRVRGAVRPAFEGFLAGAVEKGRLRQVHYRGDRTAEFFLSGDPDPFLHELRHYHDANPDLDPAVERKGEASSVSDLDFEIVLRDDVRWHDGESLSADDLTFTFAEITRPDSPWPLRRAFEFVETLEKTSPHAVRIRCRAFHAAALERWAKLPVLPAHRFRSADRSEAWGAFLAAPVGTGPYRLAGGGAGDDVVLSANPDYFRGAPRQAVLRYRLLPGAADRHLALKLGWIDVFEPDEGERRWAETSGGARVVEDIPRYQRFVAWNLDRAPFRDAAVRRALGRGIDRAGLLSRLAGGQVKPWTGLFFPGAWFCPAGPVDPVGGPEPFAGELAGAGWVRDGADGLWRDGRGNLLAFTLGFDEADRLHRELAAALVSAWKRSGVEVRLEPLPWAVLMRERLARRDFDALLLGWELDFTRDQWAVWHSSEAGPGGSNFSGLRDPSVDALLQRLREAGLPAEVTAAATALQQRLADLQPCLFLCGSGRAVALRPGGLLQAVPGSEPGGNWTVGPVTVGRAGLPASRPWWIRADPSPAIPDRPR